MGMRDLKEDSGIRSCTYHEAIAKVKVLFDRAKNDDIKRGISASLSLIFEKHDMTKVWADIERGMP